MYRPEELSQMLFPQAGRAYLESYKISHKPRTVYEFEQNLKQLGKFFRHMRLFQIHVGHLQEFQVQRLENRGDLWKRKAGASKVNHELSTMQMLLKQAGEWTKIEPFYKPLRTPGPQKPKTLSDEEEQKVFKIAATSADLSLAYWVASITCNTGAAGTELRHLRLKDLNLDARVPSFDINPDTAKNNYRGRNVVLNETALKQVRRCLERAKSLGSYLPDHYLFPCRVKKRKGFNPFKDRDYDPSRPASSSWLAKQWKKLQEATGFSWLTPHCFRHQNATLRIEAGQPIELAAKALGHSAASMTRKYVHGREQQQVEAVNAIDPMKRFGPKAVRNHNGKEKAA